MNAPFAPLRPVLVATCWQVSDMQTEQIMSLSSRTATIHDEVDTLVEHFQQHFAEHARGCCMVLFDPSVRDARDELALSEAVRERASAEIMVPFMAFPKTHRPWLLSLNLANYADSELLRASVRMAFEDRSASVIGRNQGQRVGGWLASSEPVAMVAKHFTKHVMQGEGRKFPFRFYDMRCLVWLWPLLRSNQQRTLLGPVTGWHILDATHHLLHCVSPTDAEAMDELQPDASQLLLLTRVGGVNRALAHYQHLHGGAVTANQAEMAWLAAGRAVQLRINDPDDMAALVLNALQWHAQFDRHPEVYAALEHRAPGQSGTAALAAFDDTDIQRFIRELNQTAQQGEH